MRFCGFCDADLWPDAPEEMVTWRGEPYCSKRHKERQRYIERREQYGPPRWSHDCEECGRPMFAPVFADGWWCPECDRAEEIDSSYWEWHCREEPFGRSEFRRDCPECDSHLWLFDGGLVCHNDDCDVYIVQYGREWWAMFEEEYPSKPPATDQTELVCHE